MYVCIGKFRFFKFLNQKGCGESYSHDFDKCPICGGYLIPESMVTEEHKKNISKLY